MSGTEPRLTAGDGLIEVRPAPLINLQSTPATSQNSSAAPIALESERHDSGSSLPPLFSLEELVFEAPPWLFSAGLHLAVLIFLALMFFAPESTDELLLSFGQRDDRQADFTGEDVDLALDLAEATLDTALAPQHLPQLEDSLVVDPAELQPPMLTQPMPNDAEPIRMALSGRERGMQEALLDAYGGTRATQQAVLEGLRWLARHQDKGGMWSMTGRYSDGAPVENKEAATGLALIAFQGAGYTPQGDSKEPFTKVVSRAWTSLLAKQDDSGNFFHDGRGNGQLYTQAICTIALGELYGMTGDSQYREPAQRAIDYCAKIQAPEGGWRYFPGTGSDLSVTGWFVMALQSARMAGLSVPTPVLKNVATFLDSVSREGGSEYAYQPRQGATLSMTAEGLLCRQYLGWQHADPRLQRGVDLLVENLPRWEDSDRDVYYWYYATQVCHHMESLHWRNWNEAMRVVLPENQVRKGRERGSWDPRGDRWGESGGRLYVTCLSLYMLEVYYRHLPIYQLELLSGGL